MKTEQYLEDLTNQILIFVLLMLFMLFMLHVYNALKTRSIDEWNIAIMIIFTMIFVNDMRL
tara:strand:- start:262 stop:444 length:183 start_codon:yes stop_codon:yes gene_type:complete